jgi:hypothetical protein
MTVSPSRRFLVGLAAAGVAVALAGCMSSTTYGTGKSPGVQTLEDLAGIATFGSQKEPIDYGPRARIVPPPPGTPLPPPGGSQATLASNWPKDPDVEQKKFKAEAAARYKPGEGPPLNANGPNFRLPPKPKSDEPEAVLLNQNGREAPHITREEAAAAKKLFADSRGMQVDASGLPIRRYLTDPPAEYRAPDPSAPVEIEAKPDKPKKWKWPWQ